MKTKIGLWICVLALAAATLGGCSGVTMNAEYSDLLDKTVVLSAETAARANDGRLSPDEMKQALTLQAQTWRKFQQARDGEK